MKQVLQNLRDGTSLLEEVPAPRCGPGSVLILTNASLVSAGTERMLVEFGKASLVDKARQQPDKVRQVFEKMRTDGIIATLGAIQSKLDQPLPMGYSNCGIVLDVGEGVSGLTIGDRVASNGKHAEVVCVPANLCARVPDSVPDDAAAFTVLGAIALQGIRLIQPTLGESIVVTGLGLIGLLTVQLLKAQGCRVLGIDFDSARCRLAETYGATTVDLSAGIDPLAAAQEFSRGRGVDGVLITASTKSSEPVHQAAVMCRKRGRIVLVGVTGLQLSRADFYEKELSFQVSCSYGPGRYDPSYEEGGHDYPIGYVRWTEQRNFEAVLDMMADGRIDVSRLITHRVPFDQATEAYRLISERVPCLGIVLQYPSHTRSREGVREHSVRVTPPQVQAADSGTRAVISVVGAGNYGANVLVPAFKATGARLKSIVSAQGVSGVHAARKHGVEEASTDASTAIADSEVNAVVVVTRHDSHARLVCEALKLRKHVFCEKPLAITREELGEIRTAYENIDPVAPALPREGGGRALLMVGFNRRFAPQVVMLKRMLATVSEPKAFVMTVNAGTIPAEHWTQQRAVGGGRIIGEACHFIDLLRHLAGSPITSVDGASLHAPAGSWEDKSTLLLKFEDGSAGTIHYLANGHKSFPKERLEVFCSGRIVQLDNFRKMKAWGWPGFRRMNLWRQDKGQKACAAAFVDAIESGKPSPIPFDELMEVAEATIAADEAVRRQGC